MFEFIMTLFAGFLLGALLMRCIYRKTHKLIRSGYVNSFVRAYIRAMKHIQKLDELILYSEGVVGLRENGKVATWNWLKENGWLEE